MVRRSSVLTASLAVAGLLALTGCRATGTLTSISPATGATSETAPAAATGCDPDKLLASTGDAQESPTRVIATGRGIESETAFDAGADVDSGPGRQVVISMQEEFSEYAARIDGATVERLADGFRPRVGPDGEVFYTHFDEETDRATISLELSAGETVDVVAFDDPRITPWDMAATASTLSVLTYDIDRNWTVHQFDRSNPGSDALRRTDVTDDARSLHQLQGRDLVLSTERTSHILNADGTLGEPLLEDGWVVVGTACDHYVAQHVDTLAVRLLAHDDEGDVAPRGGSYVATERWWRATADLRG